MKKKPPEHVNLERWLVSYADFITLLFAFFVVMYAISQADMAKFKAVSASLRSAFNSGPVGVVDLHGQTGGATVNPFEQPETPGGRVIDLPAGKTNTAAEPDPKLLEIRELMEEAVSLELGVVDPSEKLQMQFDSRGLIVRVAAKDFFGEGEVEVHSDLLPLLERIGRVIARTKRLVRVEGHTDKSEAQVGGFPSDWELSTARAAWVAKYWVRRLNIDPARVGVAGYAHYRPLTEKTDEWSRSRNRRVEIIVLNNQYEAP